MSIDSPDWVRQVMQETEYGGAVKCDLSKDSHASDIYQVIHTKYITGLTGYLETPVVPDGVKWKIQYIYLWQLNGGDWDFNLYIMNTNLPPNDDLRINWGWIWGQNDYLWNEVGYILMPSQYLRTNIECLNADFTIFLTICAYVIKI